MNEFLNPKSMLTPGAAGALVMFLSNTVCAVFPEVAFRYVALVLSFLVAWVLVTPAAGRLSERAGYWVLNALVVFAMGVGTTNIAANLERGAATEPQISLLGWLVGPALAEEARAPARVPVATAAVAQPRPATGPAAGTGGQAGPGPGQMILGQVIGGQVIGGQSAVSPAAEPQAAVRTQSQGFFRRW